MSEEGFWRKIQQERAGGSGLEGLEAGPKILDRGIREGHPEVT